MVPAAGWSTANPPLAWTAAWIWTLEASVMTNALPVRRMGLPAAAAAPAAYVRAAGLAVERLEQTARTTGQAAGQRYGYTAPASGFGCLVCDPAGLVPGYPGIAVGAS
jgi:hypothetical protein